MSGFEKIGFKVTWLTNILERKLSFLTVQGKSGSTAKQGSTRVSDMNV